MSRNTIILVAEAIGTFLLTGAVLMGANPYIALGIIVLLIGGISGAHVNPAVTASMAWVKKINIETMLKFWIAQLIGALLAKAAYGVLKGEVDLSVSFVELDGKLLFAEVLGAAIFLFGISMALLNKLDGIKLAAAIGGSLLLGAMFGGVLNPAIALAAAEVSIYSLIGPIIGGAIGVELAMKVAGKRLK